jgi:hypothetical protein
MALEERTGRLREAVRIMRLPKQSCVPEYQAMLKSSHAVV